MIKDLSLDERMAFIGLLSIGKNTFTRYENRKDVSFGKNECECVDFVDFWLVKAVNLGLVDVSVVGSGTAIGMVGQPKYKEYRIAATEKGLKTYNDYWDNINKQTPRD